MPRRSAPEEHVGAFAAFRRSQRRAKADRAFDRHYAEPSRPSEAGPRAALYKGEMGATHRKSARMQNAESPQGQRGASAKARSRRLPTPVYAVFAVMACLALACAIVYPSARDYYTSIRTEAKLQAEYDALSDRAAALQANADHLATDEGIEDQARQNFGWVKDGENAVVVYGLDETQSDAVYADIPSGSVSAPETWYSPILDPLFGVTDETAKTTE